MPLFHLYLSSWPTMLKPVRRSAGLLIHELKLQGLAERILVVCSANLTFQWQRELKEKFDESFLVLKGDDIRDQFGINQWLEHPHIITSLDLAKRISILPGLRQVHWDLVIVHEAHLERACPGVSRDMVRWVLRQLQNAGNVVCLGRGPGAASAESG
jgi:SNF2 family DNA or RNA helicase